MARQKLCVGIDIGSSSVKMCHLKRTKKGVQLNAFGHIPLPSETVVDGALMNWNRVVDAIQELLASHRVRHKQAALSISGHAVIIKKISLPQMTREALDESLHWEAQQFIPFDMADVYLDAQILREAPGQAGQMDVVMVAARKDYVNDFTSALAEAGLEPMVCDVDAFAVQTMFEENYDIDPTQTVVLVNLGAAKTNINIIADGISSFTRDLTIGGNQFTEEIQKQLHVAHEEAEALKVGGTDRSGADAVVPHEVQRALQHVAEAVTTEIHRSLDFYSATTAAPPPSKIYLSGGTARLQVLAKSLETRLQIPAEVIDPFRRIDISGHDEAYLRSLAPSAAVAVGLALRYPGDN